MIPFPGHERLVKGLEFLKKVNNGENPPVGEKVVVIGAGNTAIDMAVQIKKLAENDVIEVAPLAYMRGRTLSDAFIILDEGQNTTPSVVGWNKDGERLVGVVAKRQAVQNADRTIRSVKRHMGQNWKSSDVDGKQYTPQEISARTLMKLKRDAESYLGDTVTQAVITVPAYFDDAQRTATKEAGTIAGLEVLRIINEPTAAALAYGFEEHEGKRVAVYDLGGGTFDISILEISDGVLEVLSTAGNTFLGGEDFDRRIVQHLVEWFQETESIDLREDTMALQRLKDAAEKAKCDLSLRETAEISLPFIASDAEGPRHLNYELTREKLEELVDDVVSGTLKSVEQCVQDAGLNSDDIDQIVLVRPVAINAGDDLLAGIDPALRACGGFFDFQFRQPRLDGLARQLIAGIGHQRHTRLRGISDRIAPADQFQQARPLCRPVVVVIGHDAAAVQRNAMKVWEEGKDFKTELMSDGEVTAALSPVEIEEKYAANPALIAAQLI